MQQLLRPDQPPQRLMRDRAAGDSGHQHDFLSGLTPPARAITALAAFIHRLANQAVVNWVIFGPFQVGCPAASRATASRPMALDILTQVGVGKAGKLIAFSPAPGNGATRSCSGACRAVRSSVGRTCPLRQSRSDRQIQRQRMALARLTARFGTPRCGSAYQPAFRSRRR